jgi:hypothetical protein
VQKQQQRGSSSSLAALQHHPVMPSVHTAGNNHMQLTGQSAYL